MKQWELDLGANRQKEGGMRFRVWAPYHTSLQLKTRLGLFPLVRDPKGYFTLEIEGIEEFDTYTYLFADGHEWPDPVSRSLQKGVRGPTTIIDPNTFIWTDAKWRGVAQEDLIFYECHVGAFTSEGTFQAIIEKLPYLKELGITCLELMPLAECPGRCNWGYDGSNLYAPHHLYGGPIALKQLVNACHEWGIAVALDVVYNHFGPEGASLVTFGPYLVDRYHTPWGKGMNYDGPYSDEVKHFMLQNALYWIVEYHIDALRLDALHALFDFSASPFLMQLSAAVEQISRLLGKKIYLIGENDLNDSRLIRSRKQGGSGFDGWWNDDFHHALHVTLTGEKEGYYQDFQGLTDLVQVLSKKVVYQGRYSPFRKKSQGNSFRGIDAEKLIVFSQNHDQIGNRPFGDRLSTQLSFEAQKCAAAVVLLSPYLPLLFMGEEYGEKAPFEYFVDYDNEKLMSAIYEGRKKGSFFDQEPPLPDFSAFERSKLRWALSDPQSAALLALYRQLIQLRPRVSGKKIKMLIFAQDWLAWAYEEVAIFCSFGKKEQLVELPFATPLQLLMHTEESRFAACNPLSFDAERKILLIYRECAAIFDIL
jgi:maltooligosyltrehalose trehalohydrolase